MDRVAIFSTKSIVRLHIRVEQFGFHIAVVAIGIDLERVTFKDKLLGEDSAVLICGLELSPAILLAALITSPSNPARPI